MCRLIWVFTALKYPVVMITVPHIVSSLLLVPYRSETGLVTIGLVDSDCQTQLTLSGLQLASNIGFPRNLAQMFTMIVRVTLKTQACTSYVKVTLRG